MAVRAYLVALHLLLAIPAFAEVPAAVLARLRAAGLPDDSLAFSVQRVGGGVVAEHDAKRPMQPASTLKVLTSIVALETLGPAYRGRSEMLVAGSRPRAPTSDSRLSTRRRSSATTSSPTRSRST